MVPAEAAAQVAISIPLIWLGIMQQVQVLAELPVLLVVLAVLVVQVDLVVQVQMELMDIQVAKAGQEDLADQDQTVAQAAPAVMERLDRMEE